MKYFEVGVWRTEYGYYCIRADTEAEAEEIAREFLDNGEPLASVRDADVGVGYVDGRARCTALDRALEKFDVPQTE